MHKETQQSGHKNIFIRFYSRYIGEKLDFFFHKLAFVDLGNEKKEEVSQKVVTQCGGTTLYWIEVILSSMIATLGLLLNSVAVIIGAMLIAPFLDPIRSMAFAISTSHSRLFWKSGKILVKSILLAISIGFLFSLVVPLRFETTEILARTAPNLLDLMIAISSAVIVFLALLYKDLTDSIAGVAMAAALMPPLAVIGIELSLTHIDKASGSFLLFITNLFAIVLVGAFMFLFYGFSPHQRSSQSKTLKNLLILVVSIVFIAMPLISALTNISEKISLHKSANTILSEALESKVPNAALSNLDLTKYDGESIHFVGSITLPEGESFFMEVKNEIEKHLTEELQREVIFDLEIIRTASLVFANEQSGSIETQMKSAFRDILDEAAPQITLVKSELGEIKNGEHRKWALKTIFSLPAGESFSTELQTEIEESMTSTFFSEEISFLWVYLPQFVQQKVTDGEEAEQEKYHRKLTLEWENFLNKNLPEHAFFENFTLTWMTTEYTKQQEVFSPEDISNVNVRFDVYFPENTKIQKALLKAKVKKFTKKFKNQEVEVAMRTFGFDMVEVESEIAEEEGERMHGVVSE